MISISSREFIGVVLPDLDPKNQGRYKVHIPELMPHFSETEGIWVKNHVHKYRLTRPGEFSRGVYGQYFPLHEGTRVIVKFFTDDFNSGYIDRIISDYRESAQLVPPKFEVVDSYSNNRDETYVLIKTPKYHNSIYINEDTISDMNIMKFIYNIVKDEEGKDVTHTKLEFSKTGPKLNTIASHFLRAEKDSDIIVGGRCNISISDGANVLIKGNVKIESYKSICIESKREVNIRAPKVHIKEGGRSCTVPRTPDDYASQFIGYEPNYLEMWPTFRPPSFRRWPVQGSGSVL